MKFYNVYRRGLLAAGLIGILILFWSQVRYRREKASTHLCVSNLHLLGQGLSLYAQDYDQSWPAATYSAAINGAKISGTEVPPVPYTFQIAPYIHDDAVYACPSDDTPRQEGELWDGRYRGKFLRRSYALTGHIITRISANAAGPNHSAGIVEYLRYMQKRNDRNTGIVGHKVADAQEPARTVAVVENWGYKDSVLDGSLSNAVVGSNWEHILTSCDVVYLPGRSTTAKDADEATPCATAYRDRHYVPAPGHSGSGNYLMADGHVITLNWDQAHSNDFYLFKLQKK